jgi:hypothetical protein
MKRASNLYCPGCESQLSKETALRSEGFIGFQGYKLLSCPCCIFFVDNSPAYEMGWEQLEALAVSKGATVGGDRHD